jgi:ATP-dependent exoDNAse (exonuclease V) alpha subunit
MLKSDKFDRLNFTLQWIMDNDLFMWWKQIIFVWDLYQLPPVEERDEELKKYFQEKYKWVFFFHGNSFLKENFEIIELTKVHRQKDPNFIKMLNWLRIWYKEKDLLDYFNSRLIDETQINPHAVLIWMTNAVVDKKNTLELSKIPSQEYVSFWNITGDYPDDILPAEKILKFKKWARIMFTSNDINNQYINWTLWVIIDIIVNKIIIEIDNWQQLEIWKTYWQNISWEDEFGEPIIEGTFLQFPFKLAFAITAHKTQGLSFEAIVVDTGWGCFCAGQLYVALSRCRSYEWIQLLKKITTKDIKVDTSVSKFLQK